MIRLSGYKGINFHFIAYTEQSLRCKTSMQTCMEHETVYENEHTIVFAIEFFTRQDHEPSTLRTFCKLKTCVYKRARQSGQQSVRIQSALCEVARLNISVVCRIK